jgi:putative redox protein
MTASQLAGTSAAPSEAHLRPGHIEVVCAHRDQYLITAREHAILVDQPVEDGGDDAAATPVELMVGALASCVAFYAGRYLVRHGLDRDRLRVRADFTMAAGRPTRLGSVRIDIEAPDLTADQRQVLLAVASHCTVHNTLRQPPAITINLR